MNIFKEYFRVLFLKKQFRFFFKKKKNISKTVANSPGNSGRPGGSTSKPWFSSPQHANGPEGRRNAKHIAIIVVVDLASIQSQFDSSSSSATTIADDGHRPIHLIASNPTGVTAIGPALRTVATGPSSCKALACCLQGLGLLHRKLASKAVGCRHDASW